MCGPHLLFIDYFPCNKHGSGQNWSSVSGRLTRAISVKANGPLSIFATSKARGPFNVQNKTSHQEIVRRWCVRLGSLCSAGYLWPSYRTLRVSVTLSGWFYISVLGVVHQQRTYDVIAVNLNFHVIQFF